MRWFNVLLPCKVIVHIDLSSGRRLRLRCDEFKMTSTPETVTSYEFTGGVGSTPRWIDFSAIDAVSWRPAFWGYL